MQNERPLLTIAIPTYNRSAFLGELLSCLSDRCMCLIRDWSCCLDGRDFCNLGGISRPWIAKHLLTSQERV